MKTFISQLVSATFLAYSVFAFGQQIDAPTYVDREEWEFDSLIKGREDSLTQKSNRRPSNRTDKFIVENGKIIGARLEREPYFFQNADDKSWYQFPLFIGKKWENKMHVQVRAKSFWITQKFEVIAFEEVKVSAGTYNAFKIKKDEEDMVTFYWYSPDSKSLVRYESKHVLKNEAVVDEYKELKKFTPKQMAK